MSKWKELENFKMTKREEGQWEVERTVPITPEQRANLLQAFDSTVACTNAIAEAVEELFRRRTKREEEFWDEVSRLCGFESLHHVRKEDKTITINWVASEIRVQRRAAIKEETAADLLNRAKEAAVAEHNFDAAAEIRDLRDKLYRRQEKLP